MRRLPAASMAIATALLSGAFLLVPSGVSQAATPPSSTEAAMFKIIWLVATLTPQGPVVGEVPETTKFKSETECREFARVTTSRLQDWVRGRLNVDWDHEVGVRFRCEIDGNPA
jgi:hypothetical protein